MTASMSSLSVVDVEPGLPDPVRDSQTIFRAVLDAMAHPGRITALPAPPLAQPPLIPASTMVCLALVDHETPLWLDKSLATPRITAYLRFHTGAPIAPAASRASFAILDGPATDLTRFQTGTDAYPENGATVIIQVPSLSASGPLTLSGPGIDGETRLGVGGAPASFWKARESVNAGFPRGLDLILCAGHEIAALPRTTRVTLGDIEEDR